MFINAYKNLFLAVMTLSTHSTIPFSMLLSRIHILSQRSAFSRVNFPLGCYSVADPDTNPYAFGPPGSVSGSISQRYVPTDPDPSIIKQI